LQSSVTAASDGQMVPHFEVDPFWPQPLPNQWILGSVIGVDVDERDHVYIVHRTDDNNFRKAELGIDNGISECCTAAPQVLEFDADGMDGAAREKATPGQLQIMVLKLRPTAMYG